MKDRYLYFYTINQRLMMYPTKYTTIAVKLCLMSMYVVYLQYILIFR